MENEIRKDLEGELYFKNPSLEVEYFESRLEAFKGYSSDFLEQSSKAALARRYIKALAILSFYDSEEVEAFRDVYIDCLMRLGISDYCIDQEVEDYKNTHNINPEKTKGMFVSGRTI